MNLPSGRRLARVLAASVGALALLAAASCGDGDSDDEASASPTTTAPAATTQPAEPAPDTQPEEEAPTVTTTEAVMDDADDSDGDSDMDSSDDMSGADGGMDDMVSSVTVGEYEYNCIDDWLDPSQASAEVRTLDDGSLQVYSEIVIEATPAQVWEVLTDFNAMPDWSDTFQGLTGDLTDGGEAVATFLAEGQAFPFPHVLSWTDGHEFGWSDPLLFAPGIVDDHVYRIDRTDCTSTVFVQTDTLTGDDPGYPAAVLADQLVQGYAWFNQQLKAEVERRF